MRNLNKDFRRKDRGSKKADMDNKVCVSIIKNSGVSCRETSSFTAHLQRIGHKCIGHRYMTKVMEAGI